jgi:LemA protein
MGLRMTGALIALLLLAVAALWGLASWRSLTAARDAVDATWAAIDVQLQQRHDLLPALVAAVQAETGGEDETLQRIDGARLVADAATTPFERADAERRLVAGIAAVGALAERHPGLGATADFVDLQARLARIGDEIQATRRIYNADVRLYLTRRARFPGALVRRLGAFEERPYFELDHTRERGIPRLALARAA